MKFFTLVLGAQMAVAQKVSHLIVSDRLLADDFWADSDRGSLGKPAGDGMMGFRRTLRNGKTVFSEFMRIEKLAGGGLQFTPRIRTRPGPVAFRMARLTEAEVIFENAAHDFPQRILYRQVPGGLAAGIEGRQNGKDRAEDFPYRRISCKA